MTSTPTTHASAATPSPTAGADLGREHRRLAQSRRPGEAMVRVVRNSPSLATVLVVIDDQPLLVDAVVAATERAGAGVRRVEHPIVAVRRDADGVLLDVDASPADIESVTTESGITTESWIAVEVTAPADDDHARVEAEVTRVIARIVDVHDHRSAMTTALRARAVDESTAETDRALLRWLLDGHLVMIGHLVADLEGDDWSDAEGVFVDHAVERPAMPRVDDSSGVRLSRIHLPTGTIRTAYPTTVRVVDGTARRVHLFVGALSATATHADVTDIPVLAGVARAVLEASGAEDDSFTGAAIVELLQQYPRTDLFDAEPTALAADLLDVADAITARDVRVRIEPDADAEICSVRIYIPRERYTTRLRESMQRVISDRLDGRDPEYSVRISESPRAFVHVLLGVDRATCERLTDASSDGAAQRAIANEVAATARTWDDEFADLALDEIGGPDAAGMIAWAMALPPTYKDAHNARTALKDAEVLAPLADGGFDVRWDAQPDGRVTLGLYLCRRAASLTSVLPMLQSLGVDVLDEHPFTVTRSDGMDCWIYEFSVVPLDASDPIDASDGLADRFTDAVAAMWTGSAEVDEFNVLVLRCGLDWRQVTVVRAYARYLRQCGFAYSTAHVAEVLADYREVTLALVELFETSFDPTRGESDARTRVMDELRVLGGNVVGLDADRIVSAFVAVIDATTRTSFYANDVATQALSLKLRPRDIPQTPLPRPLHEIFVYSPRVEGVHMRFGAVARGGLRWSDRREDFRTEILGLVKAQAVKNAVIVPVGAKGGFVVKRPPAPTGDAAADREAVRAEGVACYREFISGLLALTDSIAGTDRRGQQVVPAADVVRRDGDDTYLVVAADKGTATFSDIANDVAAEHDFWLGDAFASGGSVGYDHKAMGITARGAWESVRRHFRELGTDVDADDFTVAGIGDMSGDVFGNGMLLSRRIRLVAAFDHRHVMVDPEPDPDTSFDERRRLFDLPRSSWADYDTRLLSAGGGVWSRETKSVPIGPEIRSALGLTEQVTALSPPDLIHAILLAPVDLLWNGGIGTYVKAAEESHADVGDKANDPIRVNGRDVRATVIGEGGNLGVTEAGRIEYDLYGGHLNTDALDNSAGVDCSDHEVNIKILLDAQVAAGHLAHDDRDALLHEMTDEVGALVLADNVAQNFELGTARAQSVEMAPVHARLLDQLADVYEVDLALEALPRGDEVTGRGPDGDRIGLTSPELATAMAHVKLGIKQDLLDGELPDNDIFTDRLTRYFPRPLRDRFAAGAVDHPLRREIVTTSLVNDVVDSAGLEHVFSLAEGAGCSSTDVVRAWVVVTNVFDLHELWIDIRDSSAPIPAVTDMVVQWRRLLFRGSRWMIAARPQPLAVSAEVTRYATAVRALDPMLPEWLGARSRAVVEADAQNRVDSGVAEPLARRVAGSLHRFCLLDIIDAADIADRGPSEAGAVYFAMMELLGIEDLLTAVSALESADRWRSLARLALRDDLFAVLRGLTLAVLHVGEPDESAAEKVGEWRLHNATRLARARTTLEEIHASGVGDLATLSVAARQLRSLIR